MMSNILTGMVISSAFWFGIMCVIAVLVIWEAIWKGIALWKCGRNNQLAWYICILIFNTIGILPIVYLLFFQKKEIADKADEKPAAKSVKKKK